MLEAYEEVRRVDVARIQNAARNAMEWFEVVGTRYADTLEPEQFMYSMLTRSQRISHENLRLRDKDWLEGYERWFAERAGAPAQPNGKPIDRRRPGMSRRRAGRPHPALRRNRLPARSGRARRAPWRRGQARH